MLRTSIFLAFLGLVSTANGLSGKITAAGRAFSDTGCRYYTSSSADFQIFLASFSGTRPKVEYSYSGEKYGKSVTRMAPNEAPMKVGKGGAAAAEFSGRVDERGSYYYKAVAFRVSWEDADGQNQKTEELTIDIPTRKCQPEDFERLQIH